MAPVVRVVKIEPPRLIAYYLEGWRYGYLESIKGTIATIRPIGARGAITRLLRVPLADTREV